MERRQVRFHGQVQGVGFRATARAVAAGFAVSGWVRNEPDGTVLLEVQGATGEVERFMQGLRDHAQGFISREDAAVGAVVEGEAGFTIQR